MKILLTGPFGNVGSNLIQYVLETNKSLGRNDHPDRVTLTCLDKKSPVTEASFRAIEKSPLGKVALQDGSLVVMWGDLTNEEDVKRAVSGQDAVVHLGAIIPPVAYINPVLAEKVNVGGTKLLLNACNNSNAAQPPRFVFASSYSLFGPKNPNKEVQLLTADVPINPQDTYGKHKAECEQYIRQEYKGEWAILRLGAISITIAGTANLPKNKVTDLMSTAIPNNQRRHGVHSKDVARAFVNAAKPSAQVHGKTLLIGGDESWKVTSFAFTQTIMGAMGLSPSPLGARRVPKDADDAFYYEEWMDTTEAQQLLDFQKHTMQDWTRELKSEVGWGQYLALRVLSPIVATSLAKKSPYYVYNKTGKEDPMARKTVTELVQAAVQQMEQQPK